MNFGYDITTKNVKVYDWLSSFNRLCFTPNIGIGSIFFYYDDDSPSYVFPAFSGDVSVRIEYALSKHIHLYATPLYNIPIAPIKTDKVRRSDIFWDYIKKQFYDKGKCWGFQGGINVVFDLKK